MSMKKRGFIILMILAVLCLVGCGETAEPENSTVSQETAFSAEDDPIVNRFLEDWIKLLSLQERRLAQENRALKQIMKIREASTWENYVYARTACAFTEEMIRYLAQNKLEPAMTEADYQALIDRGMDLEDVQAEYQIYNEITVPGFTEYDSVIWDEYYLQNLHYACYDEKTAVMLLTSAENRHEINQINLRYWYLVNNYILLELPSGYGARLAEAAQANAPTVMAQYADPFSSANDVLNEMDRILDLQEEALLKENEILTAWNVLLAEPSFTAKPIDGLPVVIRYPESVSVDDWQFHYYWKNGEKIQTYEYGLEMETLPNCMYMEAEAVALEEYQQYVLDLAAEGMKPLDMTETVALYALENGAEMMMFWEEDSMSISVTNGQACFAPLWYIHAVEQGN